jgi:microcystin-dependent protein
MSDRFVGEIRIFAGNFAPTGWAFCNGQLLPLSQNTALFSLLGTTYGGNGKSNFALPDLQGRVPMQPGQGPGLSLHDLGESGGSVNVTLIESEIPTHNHAMRGVDADAEYIDPINTLPGTTPGEESYAGGNLTAMHPSSMSPGGGGLPHNNLQPYLVVNYIIALQGIFPPRP